MQALTTAPPGRPAVSLMVVFATGSAALSPEAEGLVASLARALANPDLARSRFRIEGHTDTVGSAAMNLALSERRAEAIESLMVGRGIADAAISTRAEGEENPRVPTADGVRELQNRRVEILVNQ